MQAFGMTAHDDPEQFFDDAIRDEQNGHAFCVFSSKKTIRLIEELPPSERHVLMGATFKIVPIGEFKQLLVLYIRIKNEVMHSNCLYLYVYVHAR